MTEDTTEKILKQVQTDKSVETGHSMTEMLGTLAIIGVAFRTGNDRKK